MDKEGVAALLIALVFVASGLFYAYDRGSFREVERPDNGHKTAVWLAGAAILLCLVAVPFAVIDGRARAKFRREEKALRAARPGASVREYAGAEGEGLLFEDASGRTLLLRPVGGLGEPRAIELPPVAPLAPPEGEQAALVAEP